MDEINDSRPGRPGVESSADRPRGGCNVVPLVVPHQRPAPSDPARLKAPDAVARIGAADTQLTLALGRLLERRTTGGPGCALAVIQCAEAGLLFETFGSGAGRRLNTTVRLRLGKALRPSDLLLQLDADTFAVILTGLDDRAAAARAVQRLQQHAGGTYHLDDLSLTVSTKAGLAMAPGDSPDPDEAVRYARIALRYAAASATTDLQCFEPELLSRLLGQVCMATELQQAIQEDRLELHYQPQYDLESGAMAGAEALVRLRAADGALVAPDRFIGVAEETGLIVELGGWVMQEACRQLAEWRRQGVNLRRMAVNLSPRQLLDPDLIPTIRRAVEQSGLDYGDLELELTEEQMAVALSSVTEVLEDIAALGVRLAVDDFGTGYSGLCYLSSLPLRCLKVDRSLIQRAAADGRAARVVAAVVAAAEEFRLDVVAEGIETDCQRQRAVDAGCHLGQGFLMARPMSAGQFRARAGGGWT